MELHTIMDKKPLVLAALAACLISATAQASEPTLFSEHLVPAASMRQANRFISGLAEAPSTRQLQVVQARAAQINIATERLYLNLLPGQPLVVDQINSYRNDDGTVVWNGLVGGTAAAAARMKRHGPKESVEDPLNTATIVRNGDMLTGSVRVQGRLFRIEPVGQGRHAVIEVDEAALPPNDGPQPIPMGKMTNFDASVSRAAAGPTVVRVMVVYTRHAGAEIGDRRGWAQALIAEANNAYAASEVKVRLQLAGAYRSKYREYVNTIDGTTGRASFTTDLARFQRKNDGFLDRFHALRDRQRADIMMLVRRENALVCGASKQVFADAETAFAAISQRCGPGSNTFAHEIGHLQGARHDPAADPTLAPFAFGHGYISSAGGFSTIMALPESGATVEVARFSNPNVQFNGVPMGTPQTHDNARVLNQTRAYIGGFR